ncbi:MAG: DUF4124 domain-containing protein [Nitrosomonadales bacterium]|nr:DUF4124 domain-containing protein [Nitrosomonadales bacterium]
MKEFLLIFLMLASTGAYAALTKWVDADGRVHYSDQTPPADAKAKTLRSTSGSAAPASRDDTGTPPSAPKTIAEREAELRKTQQEKKAAAEKAAQEQANADALKANCATAQKNLRVLQEGIRMVDVDANGERSYMDDEQRKEHIAKSQQDISRYCK